MHPKTSIKQPKPKRQVCFTMHKWSYLSATFFKHEGINNHLLQSKQITLQLTDSPMISSQFDIYYERGSLNHAEYHTKHHPTKHHREIWSCYVLDKMQQYIIVCDQCKKIHNKRQNQRFSVSRLTRHIWLRAEYAKTYYVSQWQHSIISVEGNTKTVVHIQQRYCRRQMVAMTNDLKINGTCFYYIKHNFHLSMLKAHNSP